MKLKLVFILIAFVGILACNPEPQANLFVKGKIEGVRKGDLYLQTLKDTSLISLDSVHFFGNEDFELKANIEEPQLMFLYLKKFGNEDDAEYLEFFAEAGEFEFNVKMENFAQAKADKAPENHQKYETYLAILKRFKDQNLDLVSERIQTQQDDTIAQLAIDKKFDNLLRRKYLYTVNYAINNSEYEIAPFLVLSEAYNVNKTYLDTVFNSLTPQVKDSKYGKKLKELIEIRTEEAQEENTKVKELSEEVES
jgi:hypothetical protein